MELPFDVDCSYLKQSLESVIDCTFGHVAVHNLDSIFLIRNGGEQVQQEHLMACQKVSAQDGFLQV